MDNEDDEDVYGGTRAKRIAFEEEEAEVEDGGDEDIEGVRAGMKRNAPDNDNLQDKRKLKRQKKMLFRRYYNGTFYSKCSSYLMY